MKESVYKALAGTLALFSLFELSQFIIKFEITVLFLGIYLLGSCLTGALWQLTRMGKTQGQVYIGVVFPALFFPLGFVFSAFLLLFRLFNPPDEEGLGEIGEEDMAFFEIRSKLLSKPFEVEQKEVFLPAVTLLETGTIDERRAAIDVLAQIGGPEQIRLLQTCLDDPEREVYQFAHAKLTGLHERYSEAIKLAQRASRSRELLDKYVDYVNSGLLGEATKEFYRQKAVAVALGLLRDTPDNVSLLNLLAKLYLDQGADAEAQLLLEKSLSLDPDSLEARWTLTQMAYQKRDYEAVKRNLFTLKKLSMNRDTGRDEILQAITWWLDHDEDLASSVGP